MAPARPLYLAWCAVNRITASGRIAAKDQRISVEQALRAITIDAAYSWRMEQEMGSIAPGKVANFTVLEDDPTGGRPHEAQGHRHLGNGLRGEGLPGQVGLTDVSAARGFNNDETSRSPPRCPRFHAWLASDKTFLITHLLERLGEQRLGPNGPWRIVSLSG